MSDFLATTFPSDYDTGVAWCCTIGKAELEDIAKEAIEWLQTNGDEWRPVPVSVLSWPARVWWAKDGLLEIAENWLSHLQRVRRPLQGPPALVRDRGVLQLRYPHGKRVAASHFPGMPIPVRA